MTNDSQYELAINEANKIRELAKQAGCALIEVGLRAKKLKDSGAYLSVFATWEEYVRDKDLGLGMGVSTIRNYISLTEYFIEGGLLTVDEAAAIGPGTLQVIKPKLKHIERQEEAMEILKSDMGNADKVTEIVSLIPHHQQDPEQRRGKAIKALKRAADCLGDILPDEIDKDFCANANKIIDMLRGYLRR